jgi:hypothetical protein
MSHIVTIKVEVRDIAAAKAACKRLGWQFMENQQSYVWFGRSVGGEPLPVNSCHHQAVNDVVHTLVVSARAEPRRPAHDVLLLWLLRGLVDYRIEPLLVGMRRWEQDDGSPLLATIRKEGCLIPPQRAAPVRRRRL